MKELAQKISQVENVTDCNVWQKGEIKRLYINFKSQNRFGAIGLGQVFVENGKLVVKNLNKKDCSGAATYKNVIEAIEKIRTIVEG